MSPSTHIAGVFDALAERSRSLHGHKYVLPVAAWIFESGIASATAADAMVGLAGRADRARVIEALERLDEIGALQEMPRPAQRNATRYFRRVSDPYWSYVERSLDEVAPRHTMRGPGEFV